MPIEIVGTGHILGKSVDDVRNAVFEGRPDMVAVELDIRRYKALEAVSFNPGLYGGKVGFSVVFKEFLRGRGSFPVFIQYLLGLIQQDLGRDYGIYPGSDMCAALSSARFVGASVALVDRDIDTTLNRFLSMPLKEIYALFRGGEGFEGCSALFRGNLEDILEKENLEKLIDELKERAPETYKVFVDERDRYMAYMLNKIQQKNPGKRILAVVGAGHKKGIKEHLSKIEAGYTPDMAALSKKKTTNPIKVFAVLFLMAAAFFFTKAQSITHKR